MSESLINTIKPFGIEGVDNCETARSGGEQSIAVLAGRNESEPHRMSPENLSPSKPSFSTFGEGRWAGTVANLSNKRGLNGNRSCIVLAGSAGAACQEVMLEEAGRPPMVVATPVSVSSGLCRKGRDIMGGVGVLHNSVEGVVTIPERRRGTWSVRTKK